MRLHVCHKLTLNQRATKITGRMNIKHYYVPGPGVGWRPKQDDPGVMMKFFFRNLPIRSLDFLLWAVIFFSIVRIIICLIFFRLTVPLLMKSPDGRTLVPWERGRRFFWDASCVNCLSTFSVSLI